MKIITVVNNTNQLGWTVTLSNNDKRPEQHNRLGNPGNAAAKAVQLSQFHKNCVIVGDDRAMALIPDSIKNPQ